MPEWTSLTNIAIIVSIVGILCGIGILYWNKKLDDDPESETKDVPGRTLLVVDDRKQEGGADMPPGFAAVIQIPPPAGVTLMTGTAMVSVREEPQSKTTTTSVVIRREGLGFGTYILICLMMLFLGFLGWASYNSGYKMPAETQSRLKDYEDALEALNIPKDSADLKKYVEFHRQQKACNASPTLTPAMFQISIKIDRLKVLIAKIRDVKKDVRYRAEERQGNAILFVLPDDVRKEKHEKDLERRFPKPEYSAAELTGVEIHVNLIESKAAVTLHAKVTKGTETKEMTTPSFTGISDLDLNDYLDRLINSLRSKLVDLDPSQVDSAVENPTSRPK